jgi:hypothetical protein
MDLLCGSFQVQRGAFLGADSSADHVGNLQGCGEFNPVLVFSTDETETFSKPEMHPQRDAENTSNRRVVVFLFEENSHVTPDDWPCPRASESDTACRNRFYNDGESRRSPSDTRRTYEDTQDTFACRFYDRFAMGSPCEGSGAITSFQLRLIDETRKPIAQAPCRLSDGNNNSRDGVADDDGLINVVSANPPESCTVEWTLANPQQPAGTFLFKREIFLQLGDDDDEAGRRRLSNLGYFDGSTLKENVEAFQADFGRSVTGVLADVKDDVIAWHDRGVVPQVITAQNASPSTDPITSNEDVAAVDLSDPSDRVA